MVNCYLCGVQLKKVGDKWICVNCGVIEISDEEVEDPDRSYIG